MRKLILVSLVLLSGCATWHKVTGAPPAAPPPKPASELYVTPDQVDLTVLIPPPPAPDSHAQKVDIGMVLAKQRARTHALEKQVEADAETSPFRFADVMGPDFTKEKLPVTAAFFAKVKKNLSALADITKSCFERPRPFVADKHVHPPGNMTDAVKSDPSRDNSARPLVPQGPGTACKAAEELPAYSYSYPSGHSTLGATVAILLSQMVPEKRQELYARGWYYGDERVIAGVHFPTDVEAGRIQATVIVAFMMQNPQFRSDLAAARAELRGVLGLPS
ncbi:MAG: phosphatase PAP2 family protein [Alphaproteobacteria bacterium]